MLQSMKSIRCECAQIRGLLHAFKKALFSFDVIMLQNLCLSPFSCYRRDSVIIIIIIEAKATTR